MKHDNLRADYSKHGRSRVHYSKTTIVNALMNTSWKSIDVRGYVGGLISWLSDAYRVGMASRAVVGLVEVYFMFRVLV